MPQSPHDPRLMAAAVSIAQSGTTMAAFVHTLRLSTSDSHASDCLLDTPRWIIPSPCEAINGYKTTLECLELLSKTAAQQHLNCVGFSAAYAPF